MCLLTIKFRRQELLDCGVRTPRQGRKARDGSFAGGFVEGLCRDGHQLLRRAFVAAEGFHFPLEGLPIDAVFLLFGAHLGIERLPEGGKDR